jgi:hypothetical protein
MISSREVLITEARQQAERNQGMLELETQRAMSVSHPEYRDYWPRSDNGPVANADK